MKKAKQNREDTDLRSHYDFSGGVRGKYADRFSSGCTVVVLDPDVAKVFPDAVSVNETLRKVIEARGARSSNQ
jgi:hypothetical protein